jgi:enoyl-CoA hydratase/carnithine racemase
MSTLEEVVELTKRLPKELQEEVRDLARTLAEQQSAHPPARMKLTWRGALRSLRDRYTSVELQHKSLDWW